MRSRVTAFAPATVANVGAAFDVLGFALERPGDEVTAVQVDGGGIGGIVRMVRIEGDGGLLPLDAAKNTASVSATALLNAARAKRPGVYERAGIELSLVKGLPIGSGLGSSSASTVASVVAVNRLLGEPFTREELLPFAMEGERVACGSAHADNVGPSLLGGFVLVRSYTPLDIIQLPSPSRVWVTVVTPHVEVRTADARKILKASVPLEAAIRQWGNVAALTAGVFQDDPTLMGRALGDCIIEPERAPLIPGYYDAKNAALSSGALGCSISGSGPSMFAFSATEEIAGKLSAEMATVFLRLGIESSAVVSRVDPRGARILEER
jgi:homoserine kinase